MSNISTRTVALKPSDIPSPPQAAIEIMRACAQDQVSAQRLSEIAGADPVLTAEMLRIANSPFYGLGSEVSSIARAVVVLGQRALRNLALCISVRDALKQAHIPGFDLGAYWEDALLRAASARELGVKVGLDGDECFTAGLLQDFGLLVLFFLAPEQGPKWQWLRSQNPELRLALERELFGSTHVDVIAQLGDQWSLPGGLVSALCNHHQKRPYISAAAVAMDMVLYNADWIAGIYSGRDKADMRRRCQQQLEETLQLGVEALDEVLSLVPEQGRRAAASLGIAIKNEHDYAGLMQQVNLHLAAQNLEYQEMTWMLEKALRERDRLAGAIDRELELAREIQRALLPEQGPQGVDIAGCNIAAGLLSGDFFDYFAADGRSVLFDLGDVSGKGINAALLMAKTSSLFRCLGKYQRDPAALLAQINLELCETSTRGMFVSMIAGHYDPVSGEALVVNAGHMPLVWVDARGECRLLPADGPPLGITPEYRYEGHRIRLDDGCLYAYSDGATEARFKGGGMLGVKGMIRLIGGLEPGTARDHVDAIVASLSRDDYTLSDDMTILVLRGGHV